MFPPTTCTRPGLVPDSPHRRPIDNCSYIIPVDSSLCDHFNSFCTVSLHIQPVTSLTELVDQVIFLTSYSEPFFILLAFLYINIMLNLIHVQSQSLHTLPHIYIYLPTMKNTSLEWERNIFWF